MDENSSESDGSRSSSPGNSEAVSSSQVNDVASESNAMRKDAKSHAKPPTTRATHSTTTTRHNNHNPTALHQKQSKLSKEHSSSQELTAFSGEQNSHHFSSKRLPPPSSLPPTASSSATKASFTPYSSSSSLSSSISISATSSHRARGSLTPSTSGQPSPITTAATTSGGPGSTGSVGIGSAAVTTAAASLPPPMFLTQNEGGMAKMAESNNMLTLSNYVQFMTLQQQGQMGYPTLLPSACLSQSVTNPPTTLPPQYDTNFNQTYSPSFPGTFQSFAANGLLPQQLNQGLIAVDMPASTSLAQSKHAGINIGGLDQHHRFMVGGPLSGAIPSHEVARAIGVPLVVTGRNDAGAIENGPSYKKPRKRLYSETSSEMQDAGEIPGYNCSMRVSVFPSEDHCGTHIGTSHPPSGSNGGLPSSGSGPGGGMGGSVPPQQLKWQAHQVDTWHDLCDGALQDIPQIGFTVETDKGFVFSVADDTFVCQKKNHFQVTVTTVFHRTPKFIKIKGGSIQPIDKFIINLHGVKLESVGTTIRLEQSMTDRRRSEFSPIEVEVPANAEEPAKHTACRLHFGETTANNMRKRGKPNPDQKFFSLVVSLNAVCELGTFPVVAHVSERIIVRASNPGNFDNDCDYLWLKSTVPESIYHHGRVGINTDKPEEALTVNGNIRVTGRIEHPSDMRIKTNIQPVDNSKQLENVSQMKLYRYQYREGVMTGAYSGSGTPQQQVGVMAQELRNILPDAVHETSTDVPLSDGKTVSKLLVIDKDRLVMETVGAVQELKRIADRMAERVAFIEKGLPHIQPHINDTKKPVLAVTATGLMTNVAVSAIVTILLFLLSLYFQLL